MRKFTSLTVLAIIGSSDAFSSSTTTTTTAAGLSAAAFEKKKTTTQLSLSSNLPDPKAELKTVNGSLLQDEEVPSASTAEAADITTTAVAAPSYGGGAGTGPLARVGDNDQQQQPRQNKYNGLGGTAAPSKRRMVIGLQDIIKQQRNLNMHVYCNDGGAGDSKKTLNTEFTNFL